MVILKILKIFGFKLLYQNFYTKKPTKRYNLSPFKLELMRYSGYLAGLLICMCLLKLFYI